MDGVAIFLHEFSGDRRAGSLVLSVNDYGIVSGSPVKVITQLVLGFVGVQAGIGDHGLAVTEVVDIQSIQVAMVGSVGTDVEYDLGLIGKLVFKLGFFVPAGAHDGLAGGG